MGVVLAWVERVKTWREKALGPLPGGAPSRIASWIPFRQTPDCPGIPVYEGSYHDDDRRAYDRADRPEMPGDPARLGRARLPGGTDARPLLQIRRGGRQYG